MASYADTTPPGHRPDRRVSTETKAAFKTTELVIYVIITIAFLVASQVVDEFRAKDAWFFVTLLTMGYSVSRWLAKSGSRDFYDDDDVSRDSSTNRGGLPRT